jgi:hypothetical protein
MMDEVAESNNVNFLESGDSDPGVEIHKEPRDLTSFGFSSVTWGPDAAEVDIGSAARRRRNAASGKSSGGPIAKHAGDSRFMCKSLGQLPFGSKAGERYHQIAQITATERRRTPSMSDPEDIGNNVKPPSL